MDGHPKKHHSQIKYGSKLNNFEKRFPFIIDSKKKKKRTDITALRNEDRATERIRNGQNIINCHIMLKIWPKVMF